MREYIKLIRLCKYSFRFKLNLACLIIFLGIGLLIEIASRGTELIGGFYIILCSIYMYQFIIGLSTSQMIEASGLKYKLQTSLPVIANVTVAFLFYTFVVIHRMIVIGSDPSLEHQLTSTLLTIIILFAILYIYTAVVYKYFIFSVIMFCVAFMVVITGVNTIDRIMGADLRFVNVAAAGYAVVLLGGIAEYLICRLLYKKPLSDRAFRGVFRNARV